MSMLSAQCAELRTMAESVGFVMPQAATLMMGAADTIWELRGSVHRERAEADGLRMRITSLEAALEGMHLIREQDMAENAKLRELAQRADRLLAGLFPYIDYSRCTALEAVAAWRVRARELGVEVDE